MSKGDWKGRNIVYFVEGETEKKLIEVLKLELKSIYPGKVRKCNVVQERLRASEFIQYGREISVALVFDTDTTSTGVIDANLQSIKGLPNCCEVVCVPQVRNLEDELKYCCGLKDIRELTESRSFSDFKRDFLRMKNIGDVLMRVGFDIMRIWSRRASGVFVYVENRAEKINQRTGTPVMKVINSRKYRS